ncbi:branched-chain amino acid transport system II carrier protein [Priestia taiwanensis]|uniref:Branched-chain amino acid transport system carrier protein n=1 Tax=Priestia taiwanensis TaxID=1347902 RepID=A0A917AS64_9BACI|nr:branched-chain amino acid transport system II carrier protein [Priestia taiwanensis]MBM7363966.1 LIVCS family branched-chain amino acid:cation transporter [Priestia taiwanensis]GGE70558.1 branched-chain amino acid transport system carrier protein [Priestia taiwanensis]
MNTTLRPSQIISLGFMLFAIFFGAGNFIFPPLLGAQAGTNVWPALIGFLVTGVGLPLLGVSAVALFNGNVRTLVDRVHPLFGAGFVLVLYLAIGPFFAVPRTATVTFTMSVQPFLPAELANEWYLLLIVTALYFTVNYFVCLNPTKLVDAIGKVMTPILLVIVGAIIIKAFVTPVGDMAMPNEMYQSRAFFQGFVEGFLTMDAMAALVIGSVVVISVKQFGIEKPSVISKYVIISGVIAAVGLSLIYFGLTYIGATSGALGQFDNGGVLLTTVVSHLFGELGLVLLAITIAVACLSTSVGLICACSEYFTKIFPRIMYKQWVLYISIFSFGIANLGLNSLIALSLPVLKIIYPVVIVLILYAFIDRIIKDRPAVYIAGVSVTFLISLIVELDALNIVIPGVTSVVRSIPLYNVGMGWLLPAIVVTLVMMVATKRREAVIN